MFAKFIHMIVYIRFFSFLRVDNIPLYVYTTFYLSIHVDGHLGCFHILATVNTAINIGIQVYVWLHVFNSFIPIPRFDLLVILWLTSWGITTLFVTAPIPFYISSCNVMYEDFSFSTSLPVLVIYCVSFWWLPSKWVFYLLFFFYQVSLVNNYNVNNNFLLTSLLVASFWLSLHEQ